MSPPRNQDVMAPSNPLIGKQPKTHDHKSKHKYEKILNKSEIIHNSAFITEFIRKYGNTYGLPKSDVTGTHTSMNHEVQSLSRQYWK